MAANGFSNPWAMNAWRYRPLTQAAPVSTTTTHSLPWENRLKQMFMRNEAVVYALLIRTFAASDANHDGVIQPSESGTFRKAIERLDEFKALGVNTLHVMPIQPASRERRMGEAGNPYAPSDLLAINPEYLDPNSPLTPAQQARQFVDAAHQRGLHVILDVPMFASYDLARKHPELIARNSRNEPIQPSQWRDMLLFENNKALVDYYDRFFETTSRDLNVDGYRLDVARSRPPWFWEFFTRKYPEKLWLAESYGIQDASPLKNIAPDDPELLLKAGFDATYGEFHQFPEMRDANIFMDYLTSRHGMIRRTGAGKSFLGSYYTPYDFSLMTRGGVPMALLSVGLMALQPWTNPYFVDGLMTGFERPFDLFNYRPRPQGSHPEIGRYARQMLDLRRRYLPLISEGLFIPLDVNRADAPQIISFARHHQGKTLLIVANRDVNARHSAVISAPGLRANQQLADLAPSYGQSSKFIVDTNNLSVDLAPGRFHVFEIDAPAIALHARSYR